MAFRRASCQDGVTLAEFYQQLQDGGPKGIGPTMRQLLPELEALFARADAWGLTSHERLYLLSSDDWRSPWFVSVVGFGDTYYVDYLVPPDIAPWPEARLSGEAKSITAALEFIRTAVANSGGWGKEPF